MNILNMAMLLSVLAVGTASAADVLLTQSNFTYIGGFRVPSGVYGGGTFADGGGFNIYYTPSGTSGTPSIYGSSRMGSFTAEITVPTPAIQASIPGLPMATMKQNFYDLSAGHYDKVSIGQTTVSNGGVQGGMLITGGKLISSANLTYDGAYEGYFTHFTNNPTNWAGGVGYSGLERVQSIAEPATNAGIVGGYMGWIPTAWQSVLGGTALTGACDLRIISRTSYGPAVSSFTPTELSVGTAATGNALVYYPTGHQTLGTWADIQSTQYVAANDKILGVVFPEGSKSVLFFGRHGTESCYGPGTGTPGEARTAAQIAALPPNSYTCGGVLMNGIDGDGCCYDPADGSKGTHSYPYKNYVWAYDAGDLALVKQAVTLNNTNRTANIDASCTDGSVIKPWCVKPYAVWSFDMPYDSIDTKVIGAAYDSAHQIIYISQQSAENGSWGTSAVYTPIIQAYQLNLSGTPTPTGTTRSLNGRLSGRLH